MYAILCFNFEFTENRIDLISEQMKNLNTKLVYKYFSVDHCELNYHFNFDLKSIGEIKMIINEISNNKILLKYGLIKVTMMMGNGHMRMNGYKIEGCPEWTKN